MGKNDSGNVFTRNTENYQENQKLTEIRNQVTELRRLINSLDPLPARGGSSRGGSHGGPGKRRRRDANKLLDDLLSLYPPPENDQLHAGRLKRGRSQNPSSSPNDSEDTADPKRSKVTADDSLSELLVDSGPNLSPSDSPGANLNSAPSVNQQKYIPPGPPAGRHSGFSQACNSVKAALKSVLVEAMKNNGNSNPLSVTSGVEVAAIINLSKLFEPELDEETGEAASNGEGNINTTRRELFPADPPVDINGS